MKRQAKRRQRIALQTGGIHTRPGSPEALGFESRCHIDGVRGSIILFFDFRGRDVADRLERATMVEPVDPFERDVFDGFEAAPRLRNSVQ